MNLPLPINTPSRAVLWYRLRTALSLIDQREPAQPTVDEVRRVLNGESDHLFAAGKEVG